MLNNAGGDTRGNNKLEYTLVCKYIIKLSRRGIPVVSPEEKFFAVSFCELLMQSYVGVHYSRKEMPLD